jgi:DNA-binding NarL/FixJ family response regulator
LEPVRILLVGLPQMVRDMLEYAIGEQPDMVLAGVAERRSLLEAAQAAEPAFVIVDAEDDSLPDDCRRLLAERPRLRVLGVESRAGRATLFELRPWRIRIGPGSPREVVDAIRAAAARPALL